MSERPAQRAALDSARRRSGAARCRSPPRRSLPQASPLSSHRGRRKGQSPMAPASREQIPYRCVLVAGLGQTDAPECRACGAAASVMRPFLRVIRVSHGIAERGGQYLAAVSVLRIGLERLVALAVIAELAPEDFAFGA